MAERDVTVRIGTALKGDADRPLKQIGRAASEAASAQKTLVTESSRLADSLKRQQAAQIDLRKQMDDYVARTKQAAAMDRAFASDKRALTAQIEAETAAMRRQKALLDARRAAGLTPQRGGGMGGLGSLGAMGFGAIPGFGQLAAYAGPAAPVLALGAGNRLVDNYGTAFENGRYSRKAEGESFVRGSMGLPIIGSLFSRSNEGRALQERDQRISDLVDKIQQIEQRTNLVAGQRQQERASNLMVAGQQAALRYGVGGGLDAVDEARRRAGAAGSVLGTARGQEQDARRRLAESQQQVESARRSLEVPNLRPHEQQERRLQLETELARQLQLQRELQGTIETTVAKQQEHAQALADIGRQKVAMLQAEKATQEQVVKSEQDRLKTSAEQFGLLDPLKRRAALQVGQKLAAGGIGSLSGQELQLAQGINLFQPLIRQQAAANAGPEFQALVRLLGADRQLREAQVAKVAIENKIQVELKMNEQALANAFQQQVLPKIREAIALSRAQVQAEFQRWALQQRNAQGAIQR